MSLTKNTFYNKAEYEGREGTYEGKGDAESYITASLGNGALVRKPCLLQINDVHLFALALGRYHIEVPVVHQIAQNNLYFFVIVFALCGEQGENFCGGYEAAVRAVAQIVNRLHYFIFALGQHLTQTRISVKL